MARVLESGEYILGNEVQSFESRWANYCEAKFAVGVGNGLDALKIALAAVGVGPGDEVIVPSHTFVATWLAVQGLGATVVPVEPREDTFNLDSSYLESLITSKTKAIVPTHLYGQPLDLDPVLEVATANGLFDAAQAHGSRYKGKPIGSHGDAVAWSFYPTKNLGALGDAGAITTNDSALADKMRLLRNYGSRRKYVHSVPGINSRLDPIQAVVLRVKLEHLTRWNERRNAIASTYIRYSVEQLTSGSPMVVPYVPPYATPVWHLFVLQSQDRDGLGTFFEAHGVQTLIHYPRPPHLQEAFADYNRVTLPIATRVSARVISLPTGPHLSESLVTQVIEVLDAYLGR